MDTLSTTPLWPSIVALVVGIFALILSGIVAHRQWFTERRPLTFHCTAVEHFFRSQGSDYFLVLLSFVNPASIGRTVLNVRLIQMQEYQLEQVVGEEDFARQVLVFRLRCDSETSGGEEVAIASSDIFRPSLDIAPHSSTSCWFALKVSPRLEGSLAQAGLSIFLHAFDVEDKIVAKSFATLVPKMEDS